MLLPVVAGAAQLDRRRLDSEKRIIRRMWVVTGCAIPILDRLVLGERLLLSFYGVLVAFAAQ